MDKQAKVFWILELQVNTYGVVCSATEFRGHSYFAFPVRETKNLVAFAIRSLSGLALVPAPLACACLSEDHGYPDRDNAKSKGLGDELPLYHSHSPALATTNDCLARWI